MLRFSAATALVLAGISSQAQADCTTFDPSSGETVTCSGIVTDVIDDNSDNVTINVEDGTKWTDTDRLIDNENGDDLTVTLFDGATSDTEMVSTDSDAIRTDDDATITINGGLLKGDDEGIQADKRLTVEIGVNGTLEGGDKAIQADDDLEVTNLGTIRSDNEGVEAVDDAVVTNGSATNTTAMIVAAEDGVQVGEDADISNYGTIQSLGTSGEGDAIDLDSGTITNAASGRILSARDAAIDFDASTGSGLSTIDNYGEIRGEIGVLVEKGLTGEPANTNGQQVINYAGSVLQGRSGVAADLGAGNDLLSVMTGATVHGDIFLGEGADAFAYETGGIVNGSVDLGLGDDTFTFSLLDPGTVLGLVNGGTGGFDVFDALFSLDELVSAFVDPQEILTLTFLNGSDKESLRLINFESFGFANTATNGRDYYSQSELIGLSAVPLPASGVLMVCGLLGLGALRRRQKGQPLK